MSSSPDSSDPVTIKTQYGKLAEDWRHINTQIWGVPAVAISIMTGLILAAYQQQLYGWPRVISLGVGALLLFALTVEVIKKRFLGVSSLEQGEGELIIT
jgi:hypothetical protein